MENIIVILNYTSWVSNWIEKLSPYLRNTNLYIIHISRLQKASCVGIEKYESYDVSYYSYFKLRSLFQSLSPSKCLFFTFRSVLDLTIYKLCIDLGIKKLYLEHGLISNDTLHFRSNVIKNSPFEAIRRQLMHIYKYFGYTLICRNPCKEIRDFIQVYIRGDFKLLHFDHYFLLSQRSVDCFKNIFDNIEGNCTIVGYPIFMDLNQKNEAESYMLEVKKEGIIYVHQPLISDGVVSISYNDEKKFIEEMSNVLSSKYGKFTLLLHPRSDLREYQERFEGSDIEVIKSPSNYKIFIDKKLVIGHYSTALLYGLYFEIPTILMNYPTLSENGLFESIFPNLKTPKQALENKIHINKNMKEYMLGKINTYQYVSQCIESF